MTSSNDIRAGFLDYFKQRGHEVAPSSSLVPANDPTLLFTNAGMVQFKEAFLGREQRACPRAATAQRCLRAGGKHNDLENVGRTARHHTFFEMLGNFSFGDYFKEEAIGYAWDFLRRELALPEEKLWVTVYQDDDEAARIWLQQLGVAESRFSRCGEADNFWSMGETGPCGPCSEIFYDYGEEAPGGPPGSADADGDRFVEIWNLVFMQFDRDPQGRLQPLPKPSVDTGMGLERIAAVLQGVRNNYETDLFQPLTRAVHDLAGGRATEPVSTQVLCDHIRASAFLVADGVAPSNEGRGYVLRRIIRRAARHGVKLGFDEPFFHRLAAPLHDIMGRAHPVLTAAGQRVEDALRQEEERFAETLEQGLKHLDAAIAKLTADTIPGDDVFKLYDTYGFPVDLTADIARERKLRLDLAGFEKRMAEQRQRARAASQFNIPVAFGRQVEKVFKIPIESQHQVEKVSKIGRQFEEVFKIPIESRRQIEKASQILVGFRRQAEKVAQILAGFQHLGKKVSKFHHEHGQALASEFKGYETLNAKGRVTALLKGSEQVDRLEEGEEGAVILDATPFYAESGGQVGDQGRIVSDTGVFEVADTQKHGAAHVHFGAVARGALETGQGAAAQVDGARRLDTVRNHSATHILHAALREILGEHVVQKGSLVAPDRLRFDFSHPQQVDEEQLLAIERLVNRKILDNAETEIQVMPLEEALKSGALSLSGEKYDSSVRVLRIAGDFSVELCGGTHARRAGDIGLFKLVAESGVAAGVRRIEAVTGAGALAFVEEQEAQLEALARLLKSGRKRLESKLEQVLERSRQLEKALEQAQGKLASHAGADLAGQAQLINGVQVVACVVEGADPKTLRELVDRLKAQLGSAVIVLGAPREGKVSLVAGVTDNNTGDIQAGELINYVARQLGGKGGGRADLAQAGGNDPDALPGALASVADWVKQKTG